MDAAALWHVGSSRIKHQTCVPCIGRRILYLWTLKEAVEGSFLISHLPVTGCDLRAGVSSLWAPPVHPLDEGGPWVGSDGRCSLVQCVKEIHRP